MYTIEFAMIAEMLLTVLLRTSGKIMINRKNDLSHVQSEMFQLFLQQL